MTEKEIVESIASKLSDLIELCEHSNKGAFANGVTDQTNSIDQGEMRAFDIISAAKETLKLYHSRYESKISSREFMDYWNSLVLSAVIRTMSDDRKRHLGQRAKEQFFLENWHDGVARVAASSFCNGHNDRGWIATVDWFLRPGSLAKIMEGKYDDRKVKAVTARVNNAVNTESLGECAKQWLADNKDCEAPF